MNTGFHLLHKTVGPTSFSLVQHAVDAARARSPHKRPRVCHGGTLDPFAHGLLILLVGHATRLFDFIHAVPKVYETEIIWGVETDNGDPLGNVVARNPDAAATLTVARLDDALAGFLGWRDQTPHPTSAKRIDGERAYEKAHRGESFDMPASRVYLHEAAWISHDLPRASRLRMTVRGGFYVRALARDLGRRLGCGAHLASLHRTAIGPWRDPGPGGHLHIHGRALLPWMATRELADADVAALRQGNPIASGELVPADWQVPDGFPDPDAPTRGFYKNKLVFLLRPDAAGQLTPITQIPGGA